MMYEEYEDHRGRTEHALVFFYFPTNGLTNPDVLLHPMGNHPSKFQLAWVTELRNKLPNTQTDSLRDWRLFYYC